MFLCYTVCIFVFYQRCLRNRRSARHLYASDLQEITPAAIVSLGRRVSASCRKIRCKSTQKSRNAKAFRDLFLIYVNFRQILPTASRYSVAISSAVRPVYLAINSTGMLSAFIVRAFSRLAFSAPMVSPSALPSARPSARPSALPSALPSARPFCSAPVMAFTVSR